MTFTDADHAKAVELYERYGKAEWWPKCHVISWQTRAYWYQYPDDDDLENLVYPDHALSAIAWAMVERLYATGGCEVAPEDPFGKGPVCYAYDHNAQGTPHYGPTPFQALAAAVEGME